MVSIEIFSDGSKSLPKSMDVISKTRVIISGMIHNLYDVQIDRRLKIFVQLTLWNLYKSIV